MDFPPDSVHIQDYAKLDRLILSGEEILLVMITQDLTKCEDFGIVYS